MSIAVDTDPPTDHSFPEPPIPPGLSPEAAYGFQLQMWGTKRLERRLSLLPTEASQITRHNELKGILGAVDARVDTLTDENNKPTTVSAIAAWVNDNPMLKQAVLSTLILLLGQAGLLAAGYTAFRLAGWNTTPTPVQVTPVSAMPPQDSVSYPGPLSAAPTP